MLRYSTTRERGFRNDTFIMRTHNNLLGRFDGCDGLKTGYYKRAGYSIAATALRNDERIITVVVGSPSRQIRDDKAAELLAQGFLLIPPPPPPEPEVTPAAPAEEYPPEQPAGRRTGRLAILIVTVIVLGSAALWLFGRRRQAA